jgi:predicted ester cyclase
MTLVQDKPTVATEVASKVTTNVATYKHWVNDMAMGELDKAPFAEDAETSDPSGKYKGKAQILQSFKVWKTAFPKATGEITNQIAMGDQVVSEVLFKSTHTGPLVSPTGTIAPTNKPIEFKVMNITSFRNGLIQRERSYYDQADLMRQLGITAPPKP